MAAQELRWLTYLLTDLGEPPRSPPVLYVDNKAMLALCREQRLEHRTKHIALRYFLARELQQRGQLRLAYVASEANTADVFTKALAPCDHQRCCTQLGLLCFALLCLTGLLRVHPRCSCQQRSPSIFRPDISRTMAASLSSALATALHPPQPIASAQPPRASTAQVPALSSPFLSSRSTLRAPLPPMPASSLRARAGREGVRAMATKKRGKLMPGGGELDRGVDKEARVREAMEVINGKYGANTATFLNDDVKRANAETFPSGALTLDIALGGGLPKGRIVEIYGQESSGKTTLALHAIAQVQKRGGTAWIVDAEHALDLKYAQQLGVQTDKLVLCQAEEADKALEIVDTAMRGLAADIVVVDSVPALIPSQELESEMGQESIGLLARLMSKVLKKLSASASRSKCTVIFLNQMRQKINTGGFAFGSPETTTGGTALRYFASVRLDLRSIGKIKSTKDESDMGIRVRCKVAKSKASTHTCPLSPTPAHPCPMICDARTHAASLYISLHLSASLCTSGCLACHNTHVKLLATW
ncbi:unnamed protein product [Closterium sp. NIES-53]